MGRMVLWHRQRDLQNRPWADATQRQLTLCCDSKNKTVPITDHLWEGCFGQEGTVHVQLPQWVLKGKTFGAYQTMFLLLNYTFL